MSDDVALGRRIRQLRERAGVQSQELAAAIGVDPSAMSNIERGKRQVKTDELARMAAALKVSPLALLDEESLPARMPIAARAVSDTKPSGGAYERLLALTELHEVLEQAGIHSSASLADLPSVEGLDWRTAAQTLARWATDSIDVDRFGDERFAGLANAIEQGLGVDVVVEDFTDDTLAGAAISDRRFPLIFVNAAQPTQRALFSLAHELGHMLFQHGEVMTLDDTFDGTTDDEKAANHFAAVYLMPEHEVRQAIGERGRGAASLAYLTHQFGVSFESLIYRLRALGEIDSAGRDRLLEIGWHGLLAAIDRDGIREQVPDDIRRSLVSRRGRRPERRSPAWLVERTREGYRRGVVSVRPLAGLLGEDPDDLLEFEERQRTEGELSFEAVDEHLIVHLEESDPTQ